MSCEGLLSKNTYVSKTSIMLLKLCAFKQNRTATNFVVNLSLK